MKGKLVVVYGDIVADRFIYGTPKRISREAPVLILRQYRDDILLGGAGNAINNIYLARRRCRSRSPSSATMPRRTRSWSSSRRRASTAAASFAPDRYNDADEGAHPRRHAPREPAADRPLRHRGHVRDDGGRGGALRRDPPRCDRRLPRGAHQRLRLRRRRGRSVVAISRRRATARPVTLDSRYDLLRYPGVTAATPNEEEAAAAAGTSLWNGEEEKIGDVALNAPAEPRLRGRADHARQPRDGAARARRARAAAHPGLRHRPGRGRHRRRRHGHRHLHARPRRRARRSPRRRSWRTTPAASS